ncbi:unnamed protein product [Phytomonas sp. EM1]|nr:unnamed protein product [Phytomonas sp. EM1]|eukprot:CCW63906.1 unnamed protein product [Phytomonas sp. isolate EM1]
MDRDEFNKLLTKLKTQTDESVDCSNYNLNDENLNIIIAAFENAPFTAKSFNFSGNRITSVGAQELSKFLEKYPISEVKLCNNLIGEDGCKSLLSVFTKEQHLSTCDLSGNPCPEHYILRIHYLAKGISYPESLRTALFMNSAEKVSFVGMKYLDMDNRIIKYIIHGIQNLKEVDFSGTGLGDNGAIEVALLLKDSNVESVIMQNCRITDVGLEEFIKSADLPNHRTIKHIDFSENRGISNMFAQKIPSVVFNTNTTIVSWDFSGTDIKKDTKVAIERECELNTQPKIIKDAVVALRTRSPAAAEINFQWVKDVPQCVHFLWPYIRDSADIVSLNLSNVGINDNDLALLSQALSLNTSLRVLELANNTISFTGIQALFAAFQKKECNVEEINLANNDLADDSAALIICVLRANPKIKFMNVNVNPRISEANFREIGGLTCINRAPPLLRSILVNLENNSQDSEEVDLSMQSVTINDECLGLLSRALRYNTTVKKLNLSNNIIGDVGAFFFAEALSVNKTLTEAKLLNNSIGNRGVEKLCEVLYENTALKVLDLSNNVFGYDGVKDFPEMLRVNNSLRSVTMNRTRVPDEFAITIQRACDLNRDAPEVKNIFYRLQDSDKTLEKIELSEGKREWALDDISMAVLCHAMRGKSFVKLVDLRGNNIGTEGCKHLQSVLIDKECNIFCLNLAKNPIDDEGFSELMKVLPDNNSLSYLDLTETNITIHALEYAIPALKKNNSLRSIIIDENIDGASLKEMNRLLAINCEPHALKEVLCRDDMERPVLDVDLHQQSLGDSACELFCQAFLGSDTLRFVDLSSNSLTSDSVKFIIALITTCPNLEALNLSHNQIDDSSAKDIIECLENVSHVRFIDLKGNLLSNNNEEHITCLVKLNSGSLKLKQILLKREREEELDEMINLNGKSNEYNLTDTEVLTLAEALSNVTSVRALDLGNNNITDVGCAALAEVLRNNHSIEALYLDQNPLGAPAGEALFYALKINPQLHTLVLEGTQIPEEILEDIDSLLHVNQTPLKDRINMRNVPLEELDNSVQFRSTDYYTSQAYNVERDALYGFCKPELIKN